VSPCDISDKMLSPLAVRPTHLEWLKWICNKMRQILNVLYDSRIFIPMSTHIFSRRRLSLFPWHFINEAFVIPYILGTILFTSTALQRLVKNSNRTYYCSFKQKTVNTFSETKPFLAIILRHIKKQAVWKINHPEYCTSHFSLKM